MAKFKCKKCHIKYKVSSHANAHLEVECCRVDCPIFNTSSANAKVIDLFPTHKPVSFSPRVEKMLEFDDDFDMEVINVVAVFETPEKPVVVVNPNYKDDDYSNYTC